MSELRVKLTGDEADLGTVPAADVARLMLLVERAAARAASVVLGRPKVTTGRYDDVIEQSVHFRLRAVKQGSVVPVLELPEVHPGEDGKLDMEVATLGQSAVDLLMDAAEGRDPAPHPVVAKALLELADGVRLGDRYRAVTLDAKLDRGRRRQACIDGRTRTALREYLRMLPDPPMRADAVVGVLVEADFEKRTARLRTPTEPAVQVSFPNELDDDIQAALRQQATLRGEVSFDPKTHTARSVTLRSVDRGEQLVLGLDAAAFWREPSFSELAAEQHAGRPLDPDELFDEEASDEERAAFMDALAELG